jgi:hypothetical protein
MQTDVQKCISPHFLTMKNKTSNIIISKRLKIAITKSMNQQNQKDGIKAKQYIYLNVTNFVLSKHIDCCVRIEFYYIYLNCKSVKHFSIKELADCNKHSDSRGSQIPVFHWCQNFLYL